MARKVTKGVKPKTNSSTIGDRIKYVRENKNIKQEELADLITKKRNELSYFETGVRIPDVFTLSKIADILEVSTDYLLGRTELESFDVNIVTTHKTTGLSDNAIRNLKNLKDYGNGVLLDTINFLLEQEEYPYEEEMLNGTFENDEKVKEHYNRSIEMWTNKNLQNILMAIDNYFHIDIDEKQKLYLTHNKVQTAENFTSEEYCNAVSQKVVNSKQVIDKIYLEEINDRIVTARDKFQQGDDK